MQDDPKELVRQFSDRARKSVKVGSTYVVPHKFTPDGEVVSNENFNAKRDISRLSLNDFRLLAALQEKKWDQKAACEALGFEPEKAARRLKKLSYFEFEDKKSQALAAVVTPAFVAAKNVEGFYTGQFDDAQRDHLKELAKISGAYKNSSAQINIQQNFLQMPPMSPEQEQEVRKVFDTIATQQEPAA